MPARQPFTALCRAATRPRAAGRSDLHIHTRHSDGGYTPAEVVGLARRAGLAALALTDHDTLAGIPEAQSAAAGTGLEIIPGVEISAEHHDREFHLLAYFVDVDNADLEAALRLLRHYRTERFWTMVERLRGCGVTLDEEVMRAELRQQRGAELREQPGSGRKSAAAHGALGRRHLAMLLVREGRVGTVREAFARYLGDQGRVAVPKVRLPLREAIDLVRAAGGVAGWAHPNSECTAANLADLRGWGLGALEVEYPACRPSRMRLLRGLARELGLAVTGGSDCHGPGKRSVGACTVSSADLERLRGMVR